MSGLSQRLKGDLKRDGKKTVFMLVLAVLFIVVVGWRLLEKKESVTVTPIDAGIVATPTTPRKDTAEEYRRVRLEDQDDMAFLAEALPFEKLDHNPFQPFFMETSVTVDAPRQQIAKPVDDRQVILDEENRLQAIRVTGTVCGAGESIAVVDGVFLKAGDLHKGFTLKEIGERYVVFAGNKIVRRLEISF